MQKHPDITRRRIDLFYRDELETQLILSRVPLKVEVSEYQGDDVQAATASPFKEVQKGFEYGPAYTTFWFKVSADLPSGVHGTPYVVPAVGSERTIWHNGSPYCGVDYGHESFPWPSSWSPNRVELLIQAYTRNPQHRVHGHEPAREALVEKVETCEVVWLDTELQDLMWDVDFCRNLLDTMETTDPSYAHLLRGLNAVVNTLQRHNREAVARCRKILRDTLGALPGELKHTMTAVGHAHLDTAWLWPLHITHKKMAHTTANQLRLMEQYPEHVFVHSQASQYEWLEQEYPGLFQEVKEAIKRGQWEPVGSMWVEADCNLSGGEALVRQFLYGRRYFRDKLGYETKDMWLPDVFGYSASLPQILSKFGIEYFLTQKISWNQTNKFPHNTFWWQGIDGSKVWSHFPPADTYCGMCEPKELIHAVKNHKDHARSDASLYAFGYGDGGGGPTQKHLEYMRRARIAPNLPEITTKRKALDFFKEAKARSRDLMTWVGELYLEFHRGTYTSQAANKKGNRVSEFLLRDAEWLATFAPEYPASYPAKELEAAWKLVLLNQFHDIIPGSSVREVYVDSARDYLEIAEIGERIIHKSLAAIGEHFDTRQTERPFAIFQNAAVPTQGSIPWKEDEAPAAIVVDGDASPVQLVEEWGEKKLIFEVPSSAFGAVALADVRDQVTHERPRLRSGTRRIENDRWVVKFDPNGSLTSITSLEDGTEFLEPGKLGNVFQLFDDKPLFWSAWDVDPFVFENGVDLLKSESVEIVEKGPVRVAFEIVKKFSKSTLRQRISLGPTPGIRFDTEVDWHEDNKMLKVGFPINVNASRATFEIQYGHVERPTHSNTSWDAAKFEVCAQKWVDLSEGGQGVALLNDCKYGHDVKGNLLRLSLLRSPKAPDPECDMGLHRFTYVLMPHFFGFKEAGVVQAAYALNSPLRSVRLGNQAGQKAALPPFIICDDPNIVIESVKKAEDDGSMIVRLYECHNSRGAAVLELLRPVSSAMLCDLEENPIEEIDLAEGRVPFSYKPFEILTFKLQIS